MAAIDLIPIIAPELVANANLVGAITMAEGRVNSEHCFYDEAVANMAAHILTLAKRGGSSGSVASKAEGSLNISYSNTSNDNPLSDTSYGKEVMRLNRLCYGLSARTGWIDG